jgi:hypothetical protein
MTALQEALLEAIKTGTEWDAVPMFYHKWCRRVDAKASGFAGQTGAAQEAPDPRWAKDPIFEWVSDLKAAVNLAGSKSAGKAAAEETIDAVIDARVAATVAQQLKEQGAKRERSQNSGVGGGGGGGGGGGSNAAAVKTEPGTGAAQQAGGASGSRPSLAEQQAALTAEKGKVDGREPCIFHHKLGGCKFSAQECKRGYHG